MAKRIYQAKDKLVQRRVRGAMVVENVRTKKRRCPARIFNSTRAVPSGQTLPEAEFPCRIGKKDVELDLNMARGPDGRIDPLDTLDDASINSENPKARRRDKKRYDRVTGKRETAPVGDTASRKSIRRRFESEKSIRATGETTFSESDGPRRSEQFKYRSDDLRDHTFRGTVGQTTGDSMEGTKKRTQRRNASRLRFDEEELRLSTEAAYPETHDANDEDNAYVTETGYKPRHLKRSSTEAKTVQSGENEKPIGGDEEDSLEEITDAPDAEASPASEAKQRRRNQANSFLAEKAKEAASAETVEELAEGETARVENLAARKRKTRLNFSDEETGFIHGAGSLAKRTAKTAVTPAMLYANQQLHEASAENTSVQSVEAGGLAVRRTTSLAKSSKRAANRRSASKARMETVKQEHAAQVEHRKKEQIRAFQKKKRQRAAIAAKRKQSVVSAGGFVDSADTVFSIPEKAKKAAQSFFSEHKGAIIGVAVAGLLFALVGVSMTSIASLVHGGGTTVISTTYVSTDEDIYAAENAYCALEDGLNAQINDLQNTHPGFDDYEYQIDPIDHNPYKSLQYVRHADDFLIGVIGSKEDADKLKADLAIFLKDKLGLTLSMEKTKITHSSEKARFLGYDIFISRSQEVRKLSTGRKVRIYSGVVTMYAPYEKWSAKALELGVIRVKKDPSGKEHWKIIHRGNLINRSDIEILRKYNAEVRGMVNYYSLACNTTAMTHFRSIMKYSMLKTFAAKYRTKVSKIKSRYVKDGDFTVPYFTKAERKESVFDSKPIKRSKTPIFGQVDIKETYKRYDKPNGLAQKLKAKTCELCGAHCDDVEIHQVKRLKDVDANTPWGSLMRERHRKTLAVCPACHKKIHETTKP